MANGYYTIHDPELWRQVQPHLPPPDPDRVYIGGSPYFQPAYGGWRIPQNIFQNLPQNLQQQILNQPPRTPPPPIPAFPTTQPYMPDVDYLRWGMPPSIPQSFQMYTDVARELGQYMLQPQYGVLGPYTQALETLARQQQEVRESPLYAQIGQYLQSDISQLRAPPTEVVQGYQEYTDIARQIGQQLLQQPEEVTQRFTGALETLARQQAAVRESPTLQQVAQQLRQNIQYLQAEPGAGEIDQAYLTQAYENIDRTYDTARQRILQEYARRGIEPSSGIVQDQLRKIEEARAADKAKAQRDLAMWKIQEQRSRLAEARQVAGTLAQLEAQQRAEERALATAQPELARALLQLTTGRTLQALPVLQQIPQAAAFLEQLGRARTAEAQRLANVLLQMAAAQRAEERGLATMQPGLAREVEDWATGRAARALPILYQIPQITMALDQLERSRRAEARAIEQMLEAAERQRLFDMLSILGGTAPSPAGAAVVGPWAEHASTLAAMLGQQAAQTWGGLGALLGQLLGGWQQPTTTTTTQPSLWMQPVQTGTYYG